MKQHKFNRVFMDMAEAASRMSKDPTTKVGCVIVAPDNKKFSMGYNGFARGMEEDEERWQRPRKYEYVIHAELNALLNCPFDTAGTSLYCTHQPCHRCMQHILNSGVSRVFFNKPYENLEHKDIWAEAASLFEEVAFIGVDGKPTPFFLARYHMNIHMDGKL